MVCAAIGDSVSVHQKLSVFFACVWAVDLCFAAHPQKLILLEFRMKIRKSITSRSYQNKDYNKVAAFLADLLKRCPDQHNWLPGRFEYAEHLLSPLFLERGLPNWKDTIQLWECDNKLVAMVNSENPDANVYVHVDPDYLELTDDILGWAEAHMAVADWDNEQPRLAIWAGVKDSFRQSLLESRGFRKCDDIDYLQRQVLTENCASPVLPEGYQFASFADELDFNSRMATTALAFGDKKPLTDSVYSVTQSAPNYHADLDFGIVDKSGKTIALCTLWLDLENDLGYIEPVATHPDFHGQGFGKLLLKEALYRFKQKGVSRAFVGAHERVRPFYKNAGFIEAAVNQMWEKKYPEMS